MMLQTSPRKPFLASTSTARASIRTNAFPFGSTQSPQTSSAPNSAPARGIRRSRSTPHNPKPASDFRETIPAEQPNPSDTLQTAETAEAVRQAIADLPEELRTPLILSEYEDLSHAEIGSILDCSAKAVETRLYRARKILRDTLSRFLPSIL